MGGCPRYYVALTLLLSLVHFGIATHKAANNAESRKFVRTYEFKNNTDTSSTDKRAFNGKTKAQRNLTNEYEDNYYEDDPEYIQASTKPDTDKIAIVPRKEGAGLGESDNSHSSNYANTYDPDYYDWGFATWIAPGVPPLDAKNERPTTTDISCWDCDEQKSESCLLVRCDYTLVYNSSLAPKGFACMRYQVVSGKTYNKAKCVYSPSPSYDPCEEEVKRNQLPAHMQNCNICWDDGCNSIQKPTPLGVLLACLSLGLLCCLFALCIGAKNKYFCETCKDPVAEERII